MDGSKSFEEQNNVSEAILGVSALLVYRMSLVHSNNSLELAKTTFVAERIIIIVFYF